MSGLRKVAWREIRERLRSKGYIISTVVTALLVGAMILIPSLFGSSTTTYEVGSVGSGNEEIFEAATLLANAGGDEEDDATVDFEVTVYPTRDQAIAALEADEISAVLVDGTEIVVPSVGWSGPPAAVRWLQQGAAAVELDRLITEEGETAAQVIEVMTSEFLEVTSLAGDGLDDPTRPIVAYAGLILLYAAILLYGTWILTGVTEEKTNRVVEVLLSTLRPWQLLGGKILGIGALGFTQFAIAGVVALIAVRISGMDLPALDPLLIANLLLWFVIGFLIFAVLFGAAGSLASRMEDAQNVAFPMTIVAVLGLFVAFASLDDPAGTVAVIGTMVPLTAPFVVPVRVALNAIPMWQFAAALGISLASIVGLVLVAGRVYAGGLLRTGGKIGVREAWRGAAE